MNEGRAKLDSGLVGVNKGDPVDKANSLDGITGGRQGNFPSCDMWVNRGHLRPGREYNLELLKGFFDHVTGYDIEGCTREVTILTDRKLYYFLEHDVGGNRAILRNIGEYERDITNRLELDKRYELRGGKCIELV